MHKSGEERPRTSIAVALNLLLVCLHTRMFCVCFVLVTLTIDHTHVNKLLCYLICQNNGAMMFQYQTVDLMRLPK